VGEMPIEGKDTQWLAICVTRHAEWSDFFSRLWEKRQDVVDHGSARGWLATGPGHDQVRAQVRDDKLGPGEWVERRLLVVDVSRGGSELWKLQGRSFCGSWVSGSWPVVNMVGGWREIGVITDVEACLRTRGGCPHGWCGRWGMTEDQVWEWLGLKRSEGRNE